MTWHTLSLTTVFSALSLVITLAPVIARSPDFSLAANAITATPKATDLLETGKTAYRQGRFTEAATAWQTASQRYHTTGDRLNEALSLSYLSLVQQELNQWAAAQTAIAQSLQILKDTPAPAALSAHIFNTQARLLLNTGKAEAAIDYWQQAQKLYDQTGDQVGSLGSQINQAQALETLGFHRRAKQTLEAINQQLSKLPDSDLKLAGLRNLGTALQTFGDYEGSWIALKQGLDLAEKLAIQPEISSLQLNLGKTALNAGHLETADSYFEAAEASAQNPLERLQARLNHFTLYLQTGHTEAATALVPELQSQFKALPNNRQGIYSTVNFAASVNRLEHPEQVIPLSELTQLLSQAVQSARSLSDPVAEAYALRQLGQVYIHAKQPQTALEVTQRALQLARQTETATLLSQAAWQQGRLLKQLGQRKDAISAYNEAVSNLKSLRGDLVSSNPDIQFSFRDSVEPIYRELVTLLLDDPNQTNLVQARQLIESLQVAELDNFFREACLDQTQQIDQVDPTATVVYPIILSDRLALIASTAGQPLRYYTTPTNEAATKKIIADFQGSLNPAFSGQESRQIGKQLYDLLIRPMEADQSLKQTKTLVFVLDGKLRNVPMSALYDGQQYLLEKYAITLSPGLQLMAAHKLNSQNLKAVVAGISEARFGNKALPAVANEIKDIVRLVSATKLVNQQFTVQSLQQELQTNQANVVHLATHGQFSSHLEDTFLMTWDGRLDMQELSRLLKSRDRERAIELLVLSACQTAAGDDRAVLGLAGLAVKSGARSTIATLWPVNDKAAASLIAEFYQQLRKPGVTKAEALRQAQLRLLKHTDFVEPFFWSAFVLVGHWQ